MRKLIIITSSISPSILRSYFSEEQRYVQTRASIDNMKMLPDADIHLFDNSPNRYDFPDIYYHHLPSEGWQAPELAHKSIHECSIMMHALNMLDLSLYDAIIKLSGRYLAFNISDDCFADRLDCFFAIRSPDDVREWADYTQLCDGEPHRTVMKTMVYGVGRKEFEYYKNMVRLSMILMCRYFHLDIENCMYYLLKEHDKQGRLISADWRCYGYNGDSGIFSGFGI